MEVDSELPQRPIHSSIKDNDQRGRGSSEVMEVTAVMREDEKGRKREKIGKVLLKRRRPSLLFT